jgi:hypothetical protein
MKRALVASRDAHEESTKARSKKQAAIRLAAIDGANCINAPNFTFYPTRESGCLTRLAALDAFRSRS